MLLKNTNIKKQSSNEVSQRVKLVRKFENDAIFTSKLPSSLVRD